MQFLLKVTWFWWYWVTAGFLRGVQKWRHLFFRSKGGGESDSSQKKMTLDDFFFDPPKSNFLFQIQAPRNPIRRRDYSLKLYYLKKLLWVTSFVGLVVKTIEETYEKVIFFIFKKLKFQNQKMTLDDFRSKGGRGVRISGKKDDVIFEPLLRCK